MTASGTDDGSTSLSSVAPGPPGPPPVAADAGGAVESTTINGGDAAKCTLPWSADSPAARRAGGVSAIELAVPFAATAPEPVAVVRSTLASASEPRGPVARRVPPCPDDSERRGALDVLRPAWLRPRPAPPRAPFPDRAGRSDPGVSAAGELVSPEEGGGISLGEVCLGGTSVGL